MEEFNYQVPEEPKKSKKGLKIIIILLLVITAGVGAAFVSQSEMFKGLIGQPDLIDEVLVADEEPPEPELFVPTIGAGMEGRCLEAAGYLTNYVKAYNEANPDNQLTIGVERLETLMDESLDIALPDYANREYVEVAGPYHVSAFTEKEGNYIYEPMGGYLGEDSALLTYSAKEGVTTAPSRAITTAGISQPDFGTKIEGLTVEDFALTKEVGIIAPQPSLGPIEGIQLYCINVVDELSVQPEPEIELGVAPPEGVITVKDPEIGFLPQDGLSPKPEESELLPEEPTVKALVKAPAGDDVFGFIEPAIEEQPPTVPDVEFIAVDEGGDPPLLPGVEFIEGEEQPPSVPDIAFVEGEAPPSIPEIQEIIIEKVPAETVIKKITSGQEPLSCLDITYAYDFVDVNPNYYAYDAISVEAGVGYEANAITVGYLDDGNREFRKTDFITRAEFNKMVIYASCHIPYTIENGTYNDRYNRFPDNPSSQWYSELVNISANSGLVVGIEEDGITRFKPNQEITRAEATKIIVEIYMNLNPEQEMASCDDGESPFRDVKEGDWYCDHAKTAYQEGITHGSLDGVGNHLLRPNDPITRTETAVILYNFFVTILK